MAQKLTGLINLSRIPKEIITKNKNGEATIWVDVVPNKDGADQYGNTHSIQLYDKANRKVIYLGNLKTEEFGKGGQNEGGRPRSSDDLPF